MEIDRIIFPVTTLGRGKRAAIWTIGCPRSCFNCSNPELQKANSKKNISIENIIESLLINKESIEGVTLTGGDPFFQSRELSKLIDEIYKYITKDIVLFTGYKLKELIERNDIFINNVLSKITVLVDDEYIEELNENIGLMGSSNQKIYIFNKDYYEEYKDAYKWKREVQNIFYGNNVMHIGIPIKNENL